MKFNVIYDAAMRFLDIAERECEQVVFTGSFALYYHGFKDEMHDLDVCIFKPSEKLKDRLKTLTEASGIMFNFENYTIKADYRFTVNIDGKLVIVDVFEQSSNYLIVDVGRRIKVKPFLEIIQAKKDLCRPKDFRAINNIIQEIIK